MRFATLLDLAEQQDLRLPPALRESWPPVLADAQGRGWFRFQRLYDAARACVRSEAGMRRIVQEAAEDDAAEGSQWLEIQVDPTSYAPFVGGITPALEIVLDQARTATREVGIGVGVIVAASRTRHPLDARTLARLAAKHAGDGAGEVIGFGLSNDERRGDTAEFEPAFRIAARAGLASVPHGGELLGPSHIAQVARYLRPDRLGHGVRTAEDPALLARAVDSGVGFEVCPGSNVALGVYSAPGEVPLRTLFQAGAQIALGADDPLLFGSRLEEQYRIARRAHNFTDAELAELARQSVRISRAPQSRRKTMFAGIDRWLKTPPPIDG